MASGSETSFNSYTFSYQWTVNHLGTRLYHPGELSSPKFTSPEGAQPATKWRLVLFREHDQSLRSPFTASTSDREEHVSVRLERLRSKTKSSQSSAVPSLTHISRLSALHQTSHQGCYNIQQIAHAGNESLTQEESDIWVETHLKIPTIDCKQKMEDVASQSNAGPTRMSFNGSQNNQIHSIMSQKAGNSTACKAITFNRCLLTSTLRDLHRVTFDCEIKVWILDNPIHVHKPLSLHTSVLVPQFNLGKLMEENRRKNLFTDVTLVAADRKEYKAHKAVLASQSNFFKTRFSSRWQDKTITKISDRVEMTDVPGPVMEAMISYMYTGEVAHLNKYATSILTFAEEYGMEGLRKMCEHELAKSLTNDNAIDLLVDANTYNALDLKRVCMDYISMNVVSVQKSEGWKKLKKKQACHDLWVELLEKLAEIQHN